MAKSRHKIVEQEIYNAILHSSDSLPIDAFLIAPFFYCNVLSYEDLCHKAEMERRSLTPNKLRKHFKGGICVQIEEDGYKDKYTIGVDKSLPTTKVNEIIAHEIGHAAYGHLDEYHFLPDEIKEKEASLFARQLLCPSVLIGKCNFRDPDMIAEKCLVSHRIGRQKLIDLKRNGIYIPDNLGRVLVKFDSYIEDNRC